MRTVVVTLALMLVCACGSKTQLMTETRARDAAPTPPPDTSPAPCEPSPSEACNLRDDDCDGVVDEGLGFGPFADAVVLRTDEFTTGPCDTCSWAWDTTIAPTRDGFLALWYVGILGGSEMSNVFGRRLDRGAMPVGPVELLRDGVVLRMEPLTPLPVDDQLPVLTCFRIGRSDVAGWQLIGDDGSFELVPMPDGGPCTLDHKSVWTGERVVTAWPDSTGIAPRELHIQSARLSGEDATTEILAVENMLDVRAGTFRGRVGLVGAVVHPEDGQSLNYTRLDARGRVVFGPQPMPDVVYDNRLRIVGVPEGWLLISPGRAFSGVLATRQIIDLEGRAITEASPWPDGRILSDSGLPDVVFHHPSEPAIVAVWQTPPVDELTEMHVELWDERGDPTQSWSGPAPGAGLMVDPSVALVDDQLTVTWHDIADTGAPNSVFVQQFGCVPP